VKSVKFLAVVACTALLAVACSSKDDTDAGQVSDSCRDTIDETAKTYGDTIENLVTTGELNDSNLKEQTSLFLEEIEKQCPLEENKQGDVLSRFIIQVDKIAKGKSEDVTVALYKGLGPICASTTIDPAPESKISDEAKDVCYYRVADLVTLDPVEEKENSGPVVVENPEEIFGIPNYELKYIIEGVGQIRVSYLNAKGDLITELVDAPWEKPFSMNVSNPYVSANSTTNNIISCVIVVNEQEVVRVQAPNDDSNILCDFDAALAIADPSMTLSPDAAPPPNNPPPPE
jgi:hypothetical protein